MGYFEDIINGAETEKKEKAERFNAWMKEQAEAAKADRGEIANLANRLTEKDNAEREQRMLIEIEQAKREAEAAIRAKYRTKFPMAEYNKSDADKALCDLVGKL